MPRRATQSDVARLARVSQGTVSIVINNRTVPGLHISAATRSRVLQAAAIAGYHPDPRVAVHRPETIGVFCYEPDFPSAPDDFYRPFVRGIEDAAGRLGLDVIHFTSVGRVAGPRRLVRSDWHRLGAADGCLLLGRSSDQAELRRLQSIDYPLVFVGKRDDGGLEIPYVGADYVTATSDVVRRMINAGHRRIAFLGPVDDQPAADRWTEYRQTMIDSGLRPLRLAGPPGASSGITALVINPEVDLDVIMDELAAHDLSVPDRISVAVLGQPHRKPTSRLDWSGFTIPRERIGARALRLLARLVTGDPVPEEERSELQACEPTRGVTIAPPGSDGLS